MATKLAPRPLVGVPSISVVVPCYKYGHYLPGCVQSIVEQSGVRVSVLIVDDASPDGSSEVAHRLAAADPRVRVRVNPTNQGHIATYNDGLAEADGDYVVLLSADDLLAHGSLARAVALMEAHPEVGMVYGHSPTFVDTPPSARGAVRSWTVWPGEEWIGRVLASGANPVATPDVVMRGKLMREFGGYDARLPHAADFLLWLRAASRASVGRVNGADQAFYRVHGGNMHTEQYGGAWVDIEERARTFEIFFAEDGGHLDQPARLHAVARRRLAREALTIASRAEVLAHYRDSPVDKLVALARELSPPEENGELWRAYRRELRRTGTPAVAGLRRRANVAVDGIHHRVRWRLWRRSGLYRAVRTI
jgi:glycosyltransferase involved in cell wall biosynthesis